MNRVNGELTTYSYEELTEMRRKLQKENSQLKQELQQYRDNPLANMKPCLKYVRQNSIYQQNEHVRSECMEVDNCINFEDMALEFFDVFQSAYTGMIILQVKYGVNLADLIHRGIQKNTDREDGSYYE